MKLLNIKKEFQLDKSNFKDKFLHRNKIKKPKFDKSFIKNLD